MRKTERILLPIFVLGILLHYTSFMYAGWLMLIPLLLLSCYYSLIAVLSKKDDKSFKMLLRLYYGSFLAIACFLVSARYALPSLRILLFNRTFLIVLTSLFLIFLLLLLVLYFKTKSDRLTPSVIIRFALWGLFVFVCYSSPGDKFISDMHQRHPISERLSKEFMQSDTLPEVETESRF